MLPAAWRSRLVGGASAALGLAAVLTYVFSPPRAVATGDEQDYLRAAVHLARSGVHSHAPTAIDSPPPDAYREPGYPFLLAAAWRGLGVAPPASAAPPPAHGSPQGRAIGGLGGLLLAVSALAAALAAAGAGADRGGGMLAAALVLASPALRQAALAPGSEALAAALVALAGFGLVRGTSQPSFAGSALTGLAVGLAVLTRGASVVLVPTGALVLALLPRRGELRRRLLHAALFALLALAPPAAWGVRNLRVTGHFVLADRGGQVMWTRAELDRQLARESALSALCAWTPVDSVRRAGERWWPQASWHRYEWRGEGNFFTRSLRAWHAARRPPADPLAADRQLGRHALGEFAAHPLSHLAASLAVGWRGLFAERSPVALVPIDLALPLALLLAGAVVRVAWIARRDRRPAALALLAVPAALFLFHALLTEFLPRFGAPALPLVWAAVALAVADGWQPEVPSREGGSSEEQRRTAGRDGAREPCD